MREHLSGHAGQHQRNFKTPLKPFRTLRFHPETLFQNIGMEAKSTKKFHGRPIPMMESLYCPSKVKSHL